MIVVAYPNLLGTKRLVVVVVSYDCCACRCYVIRSFFFCSVFYYYIYLTVVMAFAGMAT